MNLLMKTRGFGLWERTCKLAQGKYGSFQTLSHCRTKIVLKSCGIKSNSLVYWSYPIKVLWCTYSSQSIILIKGCIGAVKMFENFPQLVSEKIVTIVQLINGTSSQFVSFSLQEFFLIQCTGLPRQPHLIYSILFRCSALIIQGHG